MITLVNATAKAGNGTATLTTDAINTVGANLITVQLAWSFVATARNLSDSAGNTWTALTEQDEGSGSESGFVIYYCVNPTTNAAHTFTTTSDFPCLAVQAWAGCNGFDTGKQAGTTGTGTVIAPGDITPSEPNCLFIGGCNLGGATTTTSPAAPTWTEVANIPLVGSVNYGIAVVYEIQNGGPNGRNPTFTTSGSTPWACASAVFKGPGASAAVSRNAFLALQQRMG